MPIQIKHSILALIIMCFPVLCMAQTAGLATPQKTASVKTTPAKDAPSTSLSATALPEKALTVQEISPADTTTKPNAFSRVTAPFESLIQSSTALVRDKVIEVAKQYLGIRYARGGQSEKGFDCSGFVRFVYSQLGVTIPRNSAAQFIAGQAVKKDATEVGDLVFFLTRGKSVISHVGIYIGDNKFIHSASSGKGVIISSLNEPYWKARFTRAASFLTGEQQ